MVEELRKRSLRTLAAHEGCAALRRSRSGEARAIFAAILPLLGSWACRSTTSDSAAPAAEPTAAGKPPISGRVVTRTGDPVTEFTITPCGPGEWLGTLFGNTLSYKEHEPIRVVDPAGRFLLEAPDGRDCLLLASATLGTGRVRVDLSDHRSAGEVLITLVPRFAIEGRVFAASNHEPISGARVDLGEEDDGGFFLTGPDGSFRIEKLAAETPSIRVTSQGFETETVSPLPLPDSNGVARIDLVLSRPGVVTGHAFRQEWWSVVLRRGFSHDVAWSDIGEDGSYMITARPGTYAIGISQWGGDLKFAREITIAEGETVRVDMLEEEPRGARVYGRVIVDGEALPDATVNLSEPLANSSLESLLRREEKTDEGGRFEFARVPPGRYTLFTFGEKMVHTEGVKDGVPFFSAETLYNEMSLELAVAEGKDIEADLVAPAGGLSVRVLSWSGKPLYVEVVITRHDDGPIAERVELFRQSAWCQRTDGSGEALFHHLPAGPVEVLAGYGIRYCASHGTHIPARTQAIVPKEGIAKVEVRLQEGSSSLEAHVLGPDGAHLTGASFFVLDSERLCVTGTGCGSDPDGGFRVESLRPGTYFACAAAEGYAPVREQEIDVEPGGNRAEIRLTRGATLTVTVTDEMGRPIPGVALEFTDSRGKSTNDSIGFALREKVQGALGVPVQVTEDSGRFRTWHLAPGRYTITASDGTREASLAAELADREAAEVRIELDGCRPPRSRQGRQRRRRPRA